VAVCVAKPEAVPDDAVTSGIADGRVSSKIVQEVRMVDVKGGWGMCDPLHKEVVLDSNLLLLDSSLLHFHSASSGTESAHHASKLVESGNTGNSKDTGNSRNSGDTTIGDRDRSDRGNGSDGSDGSDSVSESDSTVGVVDLSEVHHIVFIKYLL
jgi:hypothetical protein